MFRVLAISLLILALSGCNQSSESAAPEPTPAPAPTEQMPEPAPADESPVEKTVQPPIAETPEQARDRLEAQMPDDIAKVGMCIEPRPEICTQDYTPVCGVHRDGSRSTYSNGCTACSNLDVVGAMPGACPE